MPLRIGVMGVLGERRDHLSLSRLPTERRPDFAQIVKELVLVDITQAGRSEARGVDRSIPRAEPILDRCRRELAVRAVKPLGEDDDIKLPGDLTDVAQQIFGGDAWPRVLEDKAHYHHSRPGSMLADHCARAIYHPRCGCRKKWKMKLDSARRSMISPCGGRVALNAAASPLTYGRSAELLSQAFPKPLGLCVTLAGPGTGAHAIRP